VAEKAMAMSDDKTRDHDLHARQEQAQIRILQILREFEQEDAFALLSGTTAAWLTRNVVQDQHEYILNLLRREIEWWLKQPHETLRDQ
jgi:hypothetical protein